MLRLLLLLVALFIVIAAIKKFLNTNPRAIARSLRLLGLIIIGLLIVFLVATGRLNGFFAFIGALLALALRLSPAVLRYIPYLLHLWRQYRFTKSGANQSSSRSQASSGISKTEAYRILGLQEGASKEEILAAHRRLMQKNHPDRGGSVYLATKINQAKDLLLKNNS